MSHGLRCNDACEMDHLFLTVLLTGKRLILLYWNVLLLSNCISRNGD
jgi:hypothetical protein